MNSLSQHGEDIVLLELFGETCGRFLEIGAFDPEKFSNTRHLVLRGWSGVMVEPSPGPMARLVEAYGNHPRIRLVQAIITTGCAGLERMHISQDAFSTTEERNFERWKSTIRFNGFVWIPRITLYKLFSFAHSEELSYASMDFLSIDTEGTSVELLIELFRTRHRPRVICFEHDGRHREARTAYTSAGYESVHENECNTIIRRTDAAPPAP